MTRPVNPAMVELFWAWAEHQWGSSFPPEAKKLGTGAFEGEPYFTEYALRWRDFEAGYLMAQGVRVKDLPRRGEP